MSGSQPLEELQRTLAEAGRQISRELQEAQKLTADPETAVRERERVVSESLLNAQEYYKRKEYTRAFVEWDRACAALEGHEDFRRKIRTLKETHENLLKANRELVDIKQAMNQRAAPSGPDVKFVDGAQHVVNGQVKNVYGYLSQQLRTERTPRAISFWWPVALAVIVLAIGFTVLRTYAARVPAPEPGPPSAVDDTFLEAQRHAMERQVASLNRSHAEAAKGDREKIVQLETKLADADAKNSELERRIGALMSDNLEKDAALT